MVRVRAYSLVLSLPLLLTLAGIACSIVDEGGPGIIEWLIFAAAILLQLVFEMVIACPRCGKSPYTIGPSWGPLGIASKPVPDKLCSRCGFDFRIGDANSS